MFKSISKLLIHIVKGVFGNRIVHHAAAVSFYTIFSVPAVLVISIFVMSLVVDMSVASDSLFGFIGEYLNKDVVKVLRESVRNARGGESGILATITGGVLLLWASNSIFSALQTAFQEIFTNNDKALERRQKIWDFVASFVMVFVIGFIMLLAVMVDLVFHFMFEYQAEKFISAEWLFQLLTFLIACAVNAVLFFALYRLLGGRNIKRRNLIIGALVSSILFALGKNLLLSYITQSKWASLYGTAGNLVILLLWMYYNAIVLLIGAQTAESIQQAKQNKPKS